MARDNNLWRDLCVKDSPYTSRLPRPDVAAISLPIPVQEPRVYLLQRRLQNSAGDEQFSSASSKSTTQGVLRRDPSEISDVNWREEYVARHAPLSLGWLKTPASETEHNLEVRGIALYKKDESQFLISPLENGAICLWDLDGQESASNPVISAPIRSEGTNFGSKDASDYERYAPTIVEGVSVDQFRQKVFVASGPSLTEIDLNTFHSSEVFRASSGSGQETSPGRLEDIICTLSSGGSCPQPLTVGTSRALQLYDHRTSNPVKALVTDNLDATLDASGVSFFSGNLAKAILDPRPLHVLHIANKIHVGGRFPCILNYDRRFFPKLDSSIYTGSSISTLAAFPLAAQPASIVAGGEYKSKGSIEIYPYGDTSENARVETIRNRTSASSSKILGLIPHGYRLMFSDSGGVLKWVERDGSTLVRRWNINTWPASPKIHSAFRRGIFNFAPNEGDVARKLLALNDSESSEVCVWTGEKIGILSFRSQPRLGFTGEDETSKSGSEVESEGEPGPSEVQQRRFHRMMRRALERQADEARFMPTLGLGRSS